MGPLQELRKDFSGYVCVYVLLCASVCGCVWWVIVLSTESARYHRQGLYKALVRAGALKMQDMKMQDMKLTDQYAGHEIAGHENAGR